MRTANAPKPEPLADALADVYIFILRRRQEGEQRPGQQPVETVYPVKLPSHRRPADDRKK